MKVVLFCGGLGLRMRDVSQKLPKPMIPVGNDPILLHVMKYYAHYGHTDFILCLGYKGRVIRNFFFRNRHDPFVKRFALCDARGSTDASQARCAIQDRRITFVDTGLHANIGQRLKAVQDLVGDDELFLANYSDVLTDAPLPQMISNLVDRNKLASFLSVRPTYSFHVVSWRDDLVVQDIQAVTQSEIWINGGYFVLRREIFDYIEDGDELVEEPFQRLIANQTLLGFRHEGFWAPMDTFKDRQTLESLVENGGPPWTLWQPSSEDQASLEADDAAPVPAA